jgi:hypothetical protein
MPTGYTDRLERMGYDTRRWIKEEMVRAMGVCVMFRDNGAMSEADIKKKLEEISTQKSYHTQRLEEITDELSAARARPESDWEKILKQEKTAAADEYANRVREFETKKEAHEKSTREVRALIKIAESQRESELILNTLKLALEQLNSAYQFDYGSPPYRPDVLDPDLTLQKFINKKFQELGRSVEYHSERRSKELDSDDNRYRSYCQFTDFIDKAKI